MDFLLLLVLILLNGVFALSEMAIVSSRRPRLEAMAERGSHGAKTALKLLDDPSKMLSTVQIGITLIGVLAGAYGATALTDDLAPFVMRLAPTFAEYAQPITFGVVIVMTTLLSLILGELVPKRVALTAPEGLAVLTAPLMAAFETVTSPLVWGLRHATDAILKLLSLDKPRQDQVTEEELQSVITAGAEAGVIEQQEREMIQGVMRLADRSVRAVMTPRTEMVWLDPDKTTDEILHEIRESGHSRYPVARGDVDRIEGVVQTKDLLSYLAAHGRLDLTAVMHEPVFVPKTIPVLKLLEAMKGNPVRMLVVADEFGAVLGLVTAADLLESIAGDAALGENEGLSPPVQRDDGSWLIDGMTPIDQVAPIIGVRDLADAEGYSTVAGLVMHLLRAVPREGDRAERWPLSFEVVDMDGRRIDKVLVRRLEPRDEDPTG
jgi:putative hemolysin